MRFSWSFIFYGRMPLLTPTTVICSGPRCDVVINQNFKFFMIFIIYFLCVHSLQSNSFIVGLGVIY